MMLNIMDANILMFLYSCWLVVYEPVLSQASQCITSNIHPVGALVMSTPNTLCFDGQNDYSPFFTGVSDRKEIFTGVGIKGPNIAWTNYGFESFLVYSSVSNSMYKSVREGNPKNRRAKIFPGLTKADIKNDRQKIFQFDYPVEADHLKLVFKLRHRQERICVTVFYFCDAPSNSTNRCLVNNGGCQHSCDYEFGFVFCSCRHGYKLWSNGFNCVPDYPVEFRMITNSTVSFEQAQAGCFHLGGTLSFLTSEADFYKVTAKYTSSGSNSEMFLIGVVDLDEDTSFLYNIDGSHVFVAPDKYQTRMPGSTALINKESWHSVGDVAGHQYSCRISRDDSYLLTGYHGIQDSQLSSSPFLIETSLSSSVAFGPARSRINSKPYLPGGAYRSFWRPRSQSSKFLKVSLNSENEITGVILYGVSCSTNSPLKFYLKYKTVGESSSHVTEQYSTPAESYVDVYISPHLIATVVELHIADDSVCEGFQWDLTGRLTGNYLVDECQSKPCGHYCIDTPESFYCRCREHFHLFTDGRTCLPDTPILDAEIRRLQYPLYSNVLQSHPEPVRYYHLHDEVKTFTEASATCRHFGGTLPDIYLHYDQRYMYHKLVNFTHCKKWFLDIKAITERQSAWPDDRGLDFTLFEDSLPKNTTEEQAVFMDSEASFHWRYSDISTSRGCFVCQYLHKDCDLPILNGKWNIPRSAWTASGNILQNANIDYVVLDLTKGLNIFEVTEPTGYIQVDLQQDFVLHVVKCRSVGGDKTNAATRSGRIFLPYSFNVKHSLMEFEGFSNVYDSHGIEMKFSCGSTSMDIKSTHLLPPIMARFIRVSWNFEAVNVSFTLAMELFGCPSQTSVSHKKNPQCGTSDSFYMMKSPHSYQCMYSWCPLAVETCGPIKYYYLPQGISVCAADDSCAGMPCLDGQICVDRKTNHSCDCPVNVQGSCDYSSDMYVMVDKPVVREGETVTFYMVVKHSPNSDSKYYINITDDYSCIPIFKTLESVGMGKHKCGTIQYHARTGGSYRATGNHRSSNKSLSSNTVQFRVFYPDAVTRKCLAHLKIDGVSSKLQLAVPYYRWQRLHFLPSLVTRCNDLWVAPSDFKSTEKKWSLSLYTSGDTDRCYVEEDFMLLNKLVLRKDMHGDLVLMERQLVFGIFRLCLSVTSTVSSKTYSKTTCGFFRIIAVPLKIVIVPSVSYESIPNNEPIQLNASGSCDPNSGTSHDIDFHWYCAMKDSSVTCDFANSVWGEDAIKKNDPNLLPETGSLLNIEKSTLKIGHTYVITLTITKPEVQDTSKSVTIFSSSPDDPHIIIRCVTNCKDVVVPSNRFKLRLTCATCGSRIVLTTQEWELSSNKHGIIPFPSWGAMAVTGNRKTTLELQEHALNVSTKYQFKVLAYTTNGTVRAVYDFETNSPPTGGACSVTPESGVPLLTHFTVRCTGFWDAHRPLTYKMCMTREDKEDYQLYYGTLSTVNFLVLPEGSEQLEFIVTLTIEIKDTLETTSIVPLSVRVHSENDLSPADFYEITKTLNVSNSQTLYSGPEGFLLAKCIVEMLSRKPKRNLTDDDKHYKEKTFELIMNSLTNLKLHESHALKKVTTLVSDILSQKDSLSDLMLNYTLTMIKNLKEALFNLSSNDIRKTKDIARAQFSVLDAVIGFLIKEPQEQPAGMETYNKTVTEQSLRQKMDLMDSAFDVIGNALLRGFSSVWDPQQTMTSRQAALSVKWSDVNVEEVFLSVNAVHLDDVGSAFSFPMASILANNTQNIESVDIQMLVQMYNPFVWSATPQHINLPVMKVVLKPHGSLQPLELTNLSKPADIFLAANVSDVVKDQIFFLNVSYDATSKKIKQSTSVKLFIEAIPNKTHIVKIASVIRTLKLHVVWGTSDWDNSTDDVAGSESQWPIPAENLTSYLNHKQDPHLLFLPALTGTNQTHYFVTVRVKSGQILDEIVGSDSVNIGIYLNPFAAECSYWNKSLEQWKQDGCRVSPLTSQIKLHCQCNHLTTFSGGFFIAPNTVHPFDDVVLFLTFFDNPVVVTVVITVWLLFLLLLIWARKADHKDFQKVGLTVLADTHRPDCYLYLVCVVTGWWAQAGTTSRVVMCVRGKQGQSQRHALHDPERDLFTSGAENWFLLKTNACLGKITSVVVWHDNTGHRPAWYLKEVLVKDLQTKEAWHCVYDDWLRVDKGPKTIYADIPALDAQEFASMRSYLCAQKISRDFRNTHLWISIFSKSPASSFTRVQRLTCACSLLLTTMLTNIAFHGIPRDDPKYQVDHGDFQMSWVNVVIGVESAMLVFPVNLLIIFMFRSVQERQVSPLKGDETSIERLLRTKKSTRSLGRGTDLPYFEEKRKKCCCRLPWYFVYVAYLLVMVVIGTCSYFVMLYGLKYGYHKSLAWLVSFVTSVFNSACVAEPVKVLAVALMLTLVFKSAVEYDSGKIKNVLVNNKEDLQQSLLEKPGSLYHGDDVAKDLYVPPLPHDLLKSIRRRVLLNRRTMDVLQEVVMYFAFVATVLLVVLGHSDVSESYDVSRSIDDIFIHASYGDDSEPFYQVMGPVSMWSYLNMTLLEHLLSGKDQSVANSAAYLVGRTQLRQIRLNREETCSNKLDIKTVHRCLKTYKFGIEDSRSYGVNWKGGSPDNRSTIWSYQSGSELDTLPTLGKLAIYPGGGYVIQLPRNVSLARQMLYDVRQTAWIDDYTRAVFVEFTLFNPNVHLFTVVVLMFEFSNTGFVYPYHQIYTANFYHYQNEFETFVAMCEVVFVLFLLSFTYLELKKVCKQRCRHYFANPWTGVELVILLLGYTVIGIFVTRLHICIHLFDNLQNSDFEMFVSFNIAAFYDSLLRHIMATLILFLIIKFFKLLRFNARLSRLAKTLSLSKMKLISYAFVFFGLTMAFSVFGFLVFGSVHEGFRNVPSTLLTLSIFMIGQIDYYGLHEANCVLGPIFLIVFSMSFQFMLVHYFLILLIDAFHVTRLHVARVKTEVDMVNFIVRRFRLLMMFNRQKKKRKLKQLYGV